MELAASVIVVSHVSLLSSVLVDDEGYIKEYREDGLHSHNPAYRTMTFRDGQTVRCLGRVIGKLKPSQIPTERQLRMLAGT